MRLNNPFPQLVLLIAIFKDSTDAINPFPLHGEIATFLPSTVQVHQDKGSSSLGSIVKEKLVDIRLVANLIGSMIQSFWEKYEPIIIEMRQRYNTPKIMPMTEYLYEQVKSVRPR